jgi:hypothetical protein
MANIFNFYQFADSEIGGNIAPFWSLFSGYYYSTEQILGSNVGFYIKILNDTDQSKNSLDKWYPQNYYISFHGNMSSGNRDVSYCSLKFDGSLFPVYRDSEDFGTYFNGSQSGTAKDINNFDLSFQGDLSNHDGGTATIYPSFDFIQTGQAKDVNNINLSFNYYFTGQSKDLNNINLKFSGNLNKFSKDSGDISFLFNKIIYESGSYTHIINNTNDDSQITFGLNLISYSDSTR